jgi:S-adenosyl-L-methionine hydrolase (adenosine-forming)
MTRSLLACLLLAATAGAAPNGLIVLLTDYGTDSIYVGMLKGAIYTKAPEARVDAITNAVPPYDIATGARMLLEAAGEFPAGTTFCCIVDPGVGSARKCVILRTTNGLTFVAPDNGLLAPVAEKFGIADLREATNAAYWRAGVMSSTFHGRDIFGPVAAALAQGAAIEELGPALDALEPLALPVSRVDDGTIYGAVIRADVYGNLITNITPADLEKIGVALADILEITIGDTRFAAPWMKTYSSVPEGAKLALVQSMGLIEFAINQGDLEEAIGHGLHAAVQIRKAP